MSVEAVRPIAMPGTHLIFLSFFKQQQEPTDAKILDVGAGHGAFSKQLYETGYQVAACDLFPASNTTVSSAKRQTSQSRFRTKLTRLTSSSPSR